jgi:hypothetical protein
MVRKGVYLGTSGRRFVVLGLFLVAVGCSPIKVSLDYDPTAPFNSYATFDWLDDRPNLSDRFRTAAGPDSVFNKCMRETVSDALAARRITIDEVDPDFLVVYYLGQNEEIDVKRYGYEYSGSYGGWGGAIDVTEYREGTLVLDLIDAKTMVLVWRATAQRTQLKNSTPDDTRVRIREAVKKMFAAYPPVS